CIIVQCTRNSWGARPMCPQFRYGTPIAEATFGGQWRPPGLWVFGHHDLVGQRGPPQGRITEPPMRKTSAWISDWRPEDETFWSATGKATARRNLIWSIVAEHLGFSIWLVWSIVATKLPQAGFHYTTDELFQLVALPGLIGSLMRFPYTFAVTKF